VLGIRYYRKKRGFSQSKLAHLAHTSQSTVSLIEQGFLSPTDALLNDLATVLGVSPSFVLLMPKDRLGELQIIEQQAERTA
jgi:transcriptional regulator with XRE-family HTH domain